MSNKEERTARFNRFKENLPTIATGAAAAAGLFVAAYFGAKNGLEAGLDQNKMKFIVVRKEPDGSETTVVDND